MRTKAGLIIIFNHKFEKNLAKLRSFTQIDSAIFAF